MIYDSFLIDVPSYSDDYRVYETANGIRLSAREAFVASFLLDKFVPTLKRILYEASPALFIQWQGNCCRQTALMCFSVLQEAMPDYEWLPYEGQFKDQYGHYDHAFVIGTKQNGERLLVDLSRQMYPSLFMPIPKGAEIYPKFGLYGQMQMLSYTVMPYQVYLNSNEYYTELIGTDLLNKLKAEVKTENFDLEGRIRHGLYPFIKRVLTVEEVLK